MPFISIFPRNIVKSITGHINYVHRICLNPKITPLIKPNPLNSQNKIHQFIFKSRCVAQVQGETILTKASIFSENFATTWRRKISDHLDNQRSSTGARSDAQIVKDHQMLNGVTHYSAQDSLIDAQAFEENLEIATLSKAALFLYCQTAQRPAKESHFRTQNTHLLKDCFMAFLKSVWKSQRNPKYN